VLVTGGAGFIGSHLVGHLIELGRDVWIVDDLSTGRRENVSSFDSSKFELREGTLSDAMDEIAKETFAEVYHLAAAVGVRLIVDLPIECIETNIHETALLLRTVAPQKTPTLIASSSEVYGKSTTTPFAEEDDVLYGPTSLSRWSYACSKAIDEYLAIAWHRRASCPIVVTRFFNTIGPGQRGRWGMVVPRFVAAAIASEPLVVHGDGKQSRCFCDVRDVVTALPQLLAHKEAAGRIFNVGGERSISINDLAHLVVALAGSASTVEHVSYESAFGQAIDDLRVRAPDLTRLRSVIDFTPSIELEQTIRDLVALHHRPVVQR